MTAEKFLAYLMIGILIGMLINRASLTCEKDDVLIITLLPPSVCVKGYKAK